MTRRISSMLVALALAGVVSIPQNAQAQAPYGISCNPSGVTFGGTGINVDQSRCNPLSLGGATGLPTMVLNVTGSYNSPTPTNNGNGTYYAEIGDRTGGPVNVDFAKWNISFATLNSNSGLYYSLVLDANPGPSFTPQIVQNFVGDFQDSFNYGYFAGLFDDNQPADLQFELRAYSDANRQVLVDDVGAEVLTSVGGQPPVTATPEPATFALMAPGLAGIFGLGGFVRRRRTKKNAA
jgi:hypothetical protein